MRITIAMRLVTLGLSGVIGVGVLGAVAYSASHNQATASRTMAGYSEALSRQWNADMLHDGLRATVMASLVARSDAERTQFDTAAVRDQADEMLTNLDAAAAGSPSSIRPEYESVRPEVVTYVESAKKLVAAAQSDNRGARALLPQFLTIFGDLEGKLGAIDEHMAGAVAAQRDLSAATAARSANTIAVVVGLSVLLMAFLSVRIVRRILVPMTGMRAALATVAGGDLTTRVHTGGNDELADLGESIDATLESVQEAFRVVSGCSDEVLVAVDDLRVASGELSSTASQTSERAHHSVVLAEHVATSAQGVAIGIGQVSQQAGEIAGSATTASDVGRRAVDGALVASDSISRLGDSSAQISGVAAMIRAIADQTRLLALNATIEAARAGDAGRGFAVVANEVKDLAQEVGRATEDISTRIASIQSEVVDAVESIGAVSQVIGEINAHQGDIASAVERQASSSSEVSQGIQTAAHEASEIVGAVGVIAAAAVQTAGSAERTAVAAGGLSDTAHRLKSALESYVY